MALLAGIMGAYGFGYWARRRRESTGQFIASFWPGFGIIFGLPLLVWLAAGAPLQWDVPSLQGFNFMGGMAISPEYGGLLIGITVYTGAFITEIVRSGIQSVPGGQIEAARALGLRQSFVMRYVIIPQALRVVVPPTASQYLSLTKNSSLAIAVGYMDVTGTLGGITLNQTGREMETILLLMLCYLIISLTVSTVMNAYNERTKLKER